MAHTEFHNPNNPEKNEYDQEPPPIFEQQKVTTTAEHSFISIDVIQYRGVVRLDGIFGRRIVDVDVVRNLINALEEALIFIEENPPRKQFR